MDGPAVIPPFADGAVAELRHGADGTVIADIRIPGPRTVTGMAIDQDLIRRSTAAWEQHCAAPRISGGPDGHRREFVAGYYAREAELNAAYRHGGPGAGWYLRTMGGWRRVSDTEAATGRYEGMRHFMHDPREDDHGGGPECQRCAELEAEIETLRLRLRKYIPSGPKAVKHARERQAKRNRKLIADALDILYADHPERQRPQQTAP